MEFCEDNSRSLKKILDTIKASPPNTKKHIYYDKIFNDINQGIKYITQNRCFGKAKIQKVLKKDIPKKNRFMTKYVVENIKLTLKKKVIFNCIVNYKLVKIIFFVKDNITDIIDQLHRNTQLILTWLYICEKYSNKKCNKSLKIYIYMTELKKQLPSSNLATVNVNNINSGFSTVCNKNNEITIFREEEWFKVFIHETFHSYGFEQNQNILVMLNINISKLFTVKTNILINEAYVESWARIMNAAFSCFLKCNNKRDFYSLFSFTLEVEKLFGYIQLNKILSHNNLSYKNIIDKKYKIGNFYKEGASAFSYYVLTALLLSSPQQFMLWCFMNNSNWICFDNSMRNMKSFTEYLESKLESVVITDNIQEIFTNNETGLRMSITEINY